MNPVLLPQMTNRESWTLTIGLYDDDTGDPIQLSSPVTSGDFGLDFSDDFGVVTAVGIQFEVRRAGPLNRGYGGGYGPYYDIGSYGCGPVLTASIGNGISLVDTGIIQVYFSELQMRTLRGGTWDVGCTLTSIDGVDVRQIFRGRLPILEGNVTN